MFEQPDFVSQYFVGELGTQYWEEFIRQSREVRLENQIAALEDELPELLPQERKAISFVELDEEEALLEESKAHVEPAHVEEAEPTPTVREPQPAPVQPQVIHTVVQPSSSGDEAAQKLAKILGNFSFDAIRSEIDHRFDQLRRDLEEKSGTQLAERAMPVESANVATFQIETAKIPAPTQETAPATNRPDYSSFIMEDEEESGSAKEDDGDIDIMALLAAQARKMESISPIEMMEVYGERFTEVTLEELEKYINKNHR
jgi:hypothetical protein